MHNGNETSREGVTTEHNDYGIEGGGQISPKLVLRN